MDDHHGRGKRPNVPPIYVSPSQDANISSDYTLFGGFESPLSPQVPRLLNSDSGLVGGEVGDDAGLSTAQPARTPQTAPLMFTFDKQEKGTIRLSQTAPPTFGNDREVFRFPLDSTSLPEAACDGRDNNIANMQPARAVCGKPKALESTKNNHITTSKRMIFTPVASTATTTHVAIVPQIPVKSVAGITDAFRTFSFVSPISPKSTRLLPSVADLGPQLERCGYCVTMNKPSGHHKKNCPEIANLRPCKICGASGHMNHTIKHCPMRKKVLLKLKTSSICDDS